MSTTIQALGIDRLSRDQRIELVLEIWESIAAESSESPSISEPQKAELRKRVIEDELSKTMQAPMMWFLGNNS